MKKRFLIILTLIMLLILVGCYRHKNITTTVTTTTKTDTTTTQQTTTTEEDDDFDYVISHPNATKDYFDKEPMRTEIKNIDGINVVFQYGQVVPSFENYDKQEDSRVNISLNGEWRFTFDQDNVGVKEYWYSPFYDDSHWQSVNVPSSWDLYDVNRFMYMYGKFGEGTPFVDGYAWYRRTFNIDQEWLGKYAKINFLGVHYRAWIYINGTYVGAHEGGHTYFSMDISRYLKKGENTIAVRVYRRPDYKDYSKTGDALEPVYDNRAVVQGPVDYWPYAGITRDVYLEITDRVTVSKVIAYAKYNNLDLYAVIYNNSDETVTRKIVFNPGEGTGGAIVSDTITLEPNQVRVIKKTIAIPLAQEWSTETPNLYQAKVSLYTLDNINTDNLSATYGMREVKVANSQLYLNGHSIFLKGTNWHEETGLSGRSMTKKEYDYEFELMKGMNINFVRNSVYTRHYYAYEVANRMGILMMDDTDNMWMGVDAINIQYLEYKLSKAMAAMMAWNQINHPAVIIWCLQNESSTGGYYKQWVKEMYDVVKAIDIQQRPITVASHGNVGVNDPANEFLDILGWNEYFGYFNSDTDLVSALQVYKQRYPGKPVIITENGSWSIYGRSGTQAGGEHWQGNLFQLNYNQVITQTDYVVGYAFWNFKDYKQRRGYNQEYNGISAMGAVTFHGVEKDGVLEVNKKVVYYRIRDAVNPKPYPSIQK